MSNTAPLVSLVPVHVRPVQPYTKWAYMRQICTHVNRGVLEEGRLLHRREQGRHVMSYVCRSQKKKFSSFDSMVQQMDVVLVEFYATWCGPCAMMGKVMEDVSVSMKNVTFVKVSTEKYPVLATRYQVSALPTIILFKKGVAVKRLEGALSASQLRAWIYESLKT